MHSCKHPAGSVERIETYRQRVELGLPIFNVDDAKEVVVKVVTVRRFKSITPPDRGRFFRG